MKKFELTAENKINRFGRILFRIKACISFTTTDGFKIKEGDLGGYIEKEANLSHDGKAWVRGNAQVCGNAKVCGDAQVWGNAEVRGDARVWGHAKVCGDAQVWGDAQVRGDARVCGNAQVWGHAKVCGDANVWGNAEVRGDARVCGNAQVWGDAQVCGNAQVWGHAKVCGDAQVWGNAEVRGDARVWGHAKVCGDAQVWGDAQVRGDARVCGNASIFSPDHIFCVTPIGASSSPLTLFRTKKHEISVSFEFDFLSIEGFILLTKEWTDKQKNVAFAAVSLAEQHIDLSEDEPELKNCPFCGCKAELGHDTDGFCVYCSNCGAWVGTFEKKEDAVERWNSRTGECYGDCLKKKN